MYAPTILTRADVVVGRDGFITDKATDSIVGLVTRDRNGAGQPIWRANSGDVGSFAFQRAAAVEAVLFLHNMQEKARAYDLLTRVLTPSEVADMVKSARAMRAKS